MVATRDRQRPRLHLFARSDAHAKGLLLCSWHALLFQYAFHIGPRVHQELFRAFIVIRLDGRPYVLVVVWQTPRHDAARVRQTRRNTSRAYALWSTNARCSTSSAFATRSHDCNAAQPRLARSSHTAR